MDFFLSCFAALLLLALLTFYVALMKYEMNQISSTKNDENINNILQELKEKFNSSHFLCQCASWLMVTSSIFLLLHFIGT